ncbi:MAG: hypothetical protein ABSE52_09360 [Candidatus Dormibacteria bacterium]|jgi:hypothetical protein
MVAALVTVLVGAGVLGGYVLGVWANGTTTLRATVYVGDQMASGEAGGWWYGFQETVPLWEDAQGSWHEGGWPSCLDQVGVERTITFGWVPASVPGGGTMRDVVWVACPAA